MSGGPVLNDQGQVVGVNGRGMNRPASSQYQYRDGSGVAQVIMQKQLFALGVPIETYFKIAPKNPFDKISPPISGVIYVKYDPGNLKSEVSSSIGTGQNNDVNGLFGFIITAIVITFEQIILGLVIQRGFTKLEKSVSSVSDLIKKIIDPKK